MKSVFIFALTVLLASPVFSEPAKSLESESVASPNMRIENADIRVKAKGIVCSFCAQGLKLGFRETGAVSKLIFNTEFNAMDILLNEKATLTDKEIETIIVESGFVLESITRF